MRTADERAMADAFREWFRKTKTATPHSNADVDKWAEAFEAGWKAKTRCA